MKKLLILFFSLMIFSFSFSKVDYLKGISLEKIETRLLNDDFTLDKDKEVYSFRRKEDSYTQMVIISLDKGKPFSIEMTSSDLRSVTNEDIVMDELISMAIYIRDAIIANKTLYTGLTNIVNEMPSGKTDAAIETHKVGNYFIHVLNKKNRKRITISCDQ